MEVVLASASKRRKELLSLLIDDFKVIPSNIDEKIKNIPPKKLVKNIALKKGREVKQKVNKKNVLIISADTMVFLKKQKSWEKIGKTDNKKDAKRILNQLSGKKHLVITGVCFFRNSKKNCFIDESEVFFREIKEKELEEYLDQAAWQDKAGAYAIQEQGGGFVKKYTGSLSNIWGFPLGKVAKTLKRAGFEVKSNWPQRFNKISNEKRKVFL